MQVQDFWAWRDFLASRAHEHEREPLWINLDETAVAMACPSVRGMVVQKKVALRKSSAAESEPLQSALDDDACLLVDS